KQDSGNEKNEITKKSESIEDVVKDIMSALTLAEGFKYQSWANAGCVDWHISGICVKWKHGHPVIAPKVSMWLPVLILEAPNKFAYSKIDIINMIMKAVGAIEQSAASTLGSPAQITSGSIVADKDHPLQLREIHILGFPLKAFEIMHPKPKYCDSPTTDLFPYYFSELDILNWRQTADQLTFKRYLAGFLQAAQICSLANIPSNLINYFGGNAGSVSLGNVCIGDWATLYPRVGFVQQSSEVVGSAVDAVRGASWDSQDNNQPRFMISSIPLSISISADKIQLAVPKKTDCIYIGTNFKNWDKNLVSKDGNYVWIYWKKFTCCMW
ncbi:MAG: TraU family protein, partial [Desulfurella sp.]